MLKLNQRETTNYVIRELRKMARNLEHGHIKIDSITKERGVEWGPTWDDPNCTWHSSTVRLYITYTDSRLSEHYA